MHNGKINPRDIGVDTSQWINVQRGSLIVTDMYTMRLEVMGFSYGIYVGESGGWYDMLDLIEILLDEKLPADIELDSEGWITGFKVYPSFDAEHRDDVWIEVDHVRTGGLRGSDDFRIIADRTELLELLFDSIDQSIHKMNIPLEKLNSEVYFDANRYSALKDKWKSAR